MKHHEKINSHSISENIEKLGECDPDGTTKVSEILDEFHENAFLLALIFFGLPIAIPLPYPPGFTTIMGAPLLILSVQMILGYSRVKLPARICNYAISNATLISISKKASPILRLLEKYLTPRLDFANFVYAEQILGIMNLVCAVCVAIPLPFTNSIPAWGIVITSLGMLRKDGVVIIGGVIVGILGVIIALSATIAAWLVTKTVMASFIDKML